MIVKASVKKFDKKDSSRPGGEAPAVTPVDEVCRFRSKPQLHGNTVFRINV